MIFKESALVKLLKGAYKNGYEIIPNGERITVCAESWAIDAERWAVPIKASLTLIEHAECIPNRPLKVKERNAPQTMLEQMALIHLERAGTGGSDEWQSATKLPVIYKENRQLYLSDGGGVYAFDKEIIDILDDETAKRSAMLRGGYYAAGVFELGGCWLMIAPATLTIPDREILAELGKLNWGNASNYSGDECESMSLFDVGDGE